MNKENTAQALTKNDFMQAVALAGGPKAVQAAFDGLRLANDQLEKEYDRILERYPSITTTVQGGTVRDACKADRRLAWERPARSLLHCVCSSHRSSSSGPNRSRGSISRTTL